jgi:acetolactate synthase I/II/III large subunit
MMNAQELKTTVRLPLDLVVLILQDDAYGMIRWKQATDGFADFGMTLGTKVMSTFVARSSISKPRWYGVPGSMLATVSWPGRVRTDSSSSRSVR